MIAEEEVVMDGAHFTPFAALIGGLLIGTASVVLLWFNGRIAGISGIVGGLVRPRTGEVGWRVAFLLGLMLAPWLYGVFHPLPEIQVQASTGLLIVAGLLVGFGTRYGSGCTSGHGVCGLSRFSLRSLVATLCFMLVGAVTVFMVRHVLGGVA